MAEVRLQEGESLENASDVSNAKVQTEDMMTEREASLLLFETLRETPCEASLGQKRARKKTLKESDQVAPRRATAAK
jgi:hypothetical protein